MEVQQFTLQASGTANDTADISPSGVRIYRDVNSNGSYDAGTDQLLAQADGYPIDNGTITFSGFNRTITAGSTEDWLVVYDLSGTASNGETFVAIISRSSIVAVGQTSGQTLTVGGNSVTSGTMTVSAEGTMTLALGPSTPTAGAIAPGAQNIPMLQLQLSASTAESLYVEQIVFKAEGTGDDLNKVTNVELWDDLDGNGQAEVGVDSSMFATANLCRGQRAGDACVRR